MPATPAADQQRTAADLHQACLPDCHGGPCKYLLCADDLGDAGPAVNVCAVCDDGESDRVKAHGALFVGAAGQHQPQLLYQTLPQLRWSGCGTYEAKHPILL